VKRDLRFEFWLAPEVTSGDGAGRGGAERSNRPDRLVLQFRPT